MKVLVTAKQRGSTNALAPVAKELIARGHEVRIYATGNETEAAGFQGLEYRFLDFSFKDLTEELFYSSVVRHYEAIVVGLSGYNTPDGHFVRAANALKIPVVAVNDQNASYKLRLGENPRDLPTLMGVMDEECINTARKELNGEMGEETAKRCRVVGWPAFDHYMEIRNKFTLEDKTNLLFDLGINPEKETYVHFTQSIHPLSAYAQRLGEPFDKAVKEFLYEQGVAQFTFEAASDLGLRLVVKPHPGEEFGRNYTKELADRHGFIYILARACNTQRLILAAGAVTAGRSTCLTEATLLDRNTGGIIPDMGEEWIKPFPPLALEAIPYTQTWEEIPEVLKKVTSSDEAVQKQLAESRKKFSVDGQASKRVADLIESLK